MTQATPQQQPAAQAPQTRKQTLKGLIRKASRSQSKLRLGLVGPSGSGKTLSSLRIAKGMGMSGKTLLVDTENSGDLYAGHPLLDDFEYAVIPMNAPYQPKKYIEIMKLAEEEGFEVIILDSLSHAWAGEGGLLDEHGKRSANKANSFTAWREVTPQHNALINAIIQSGIHVIATMRAKTEYAMDEKNRPQKIGLAPVQREGMDYEFTTVLDINVETHFATASKDRTSLFDAPFQITEETGKSLLSWLNVQ